MTGDSVSPSDGQTPSAVETAVRRALRIPGVRVDRERFLLKQASGLCPDDGARRRVLSEGIAAMLTEPELRALGLRRVLQLTAWSSSAAVAAALPGGPLSDQELEQLLLLFGTLLEVEGAAAAVRLTGPRLERDGRPVGYGHESTGSAGAGLPADLLRRSFAGPISHRVLARVASRMGSTVLRRGTLRAVPLLGAIGAGGTAFSTLQAQGRILNHELAEGLDYTAGKVMADVETLRRALGTG